MIYVRRPDPPAVLDTSDSTSAASKENAKAKSFYRTRANEFKNFNFSVYSNREIKGALEALFNGKCAYCETKYLKTSPTDIEHFRPKGGVVVDGDFYWPGYWWLAAEWTNLLPSCIGCNRKRRYRFPGEPKDQARGKENLFPLLVEDDRAGWDKGEERGEKPALLDPCSDKRPDAYLKFWQEGGGVAARAKLDRERLKRAKESIKVYGLDRPELRAARAEHQTRVLDAGSAVIKSFKKLKANPASAKRRQKLADKLRDLNAFRAADQEYAALGRELARPVLVEIRRWLSQQLNLTVRAFLSAHPAAPLDRTPLQAFQDQIDQLRG